MGKTLGKCDALEVEVAAEKVIGWRHAIVRRNRFPVSTFNFYKLVSLGDGLLRQKKK